MPQPYSVEVLFLPGLADVVAEELVERLGLRRRPRPVPGRDDALVFGYAGPPGRLATVRTVVAAFRILTFPVPRPRSLSSGDHLRHLVTAVRTVRGARSFRFDAAGSDSAAFRRLAEQLAGASGLAYRPDEGDVLLRFRRSAYLPSGWDVLVRTTVRPLSRRTWRVVDVPGAANATVAAAMARLCRPGRTERVVNLMCGSGTLLIERLLVRPAAVAVGVDTDSTALAACAENLAGAGVAATLVKADVAADDWLADGPYDLLLAEPPWGGAAGDHDLDGALYTCLLDRAHTAATSAARLLVLTHEAHLMERCLRQNPYWQVDSVTRVFHKGHHPRVYLLRHRTG